MQRRDDRYHDGDRLVDARGNVGFVRRCRGDKGDYLKVRIYSGPQAGRWVWPEKFALPTLDWTETGPPETCADCARTFRGGIDRYGLRQIFCVQCDRQHEALERRQAADASPTHHFGAGVMRPRVSPAQLVSDEAEKDVQRRQLWDDVEEEIAREAGKSR